MAHLVDAEPLVGSTEEAGEVALEVLDRVDLAGKGVVDVDDNDLPVGLTLVKEGHDTEDLDLLDLASVADSLTDLADVEGVVVTVGTGLGVLVPDVTVVGEAVTDETELALLGVLEDGVEGLLLADLHLGVGPAGNLNNHCGG
jgi:hypothetical protein